ncbi:MAG: enolase C-terminal domain-like protein [Alphaproteobacteria bacterium]|nr:enolase C-terminal domain-like protein [Alphaproteobacteria bacterium]
MGAPADHQSRLPRISDVRVTPIAFRDPPLLNVAGVHEPFALRSILEVEAEDGTIGLGESYGDTATLAALAAVAPQLVGLSPWDMAGLINAATLSITGSPATGAPYPAVADKTLAVTIGAFEVAMLDLQARLLGLPLHALLGGAVRERVPFAAYLFYKFAHHRDDPGYPADPWGEALSDADLVAQAQRMVRAYGFGSLKLKAGVFPPEREIATLHALRHAFPDHPLRIDPNGGWSLSTAKRLLPQLEGVVEYLEDPVPTLADMGQLAAETTLPLATNMVTVAFGHLPETLRLGAVQVVLSDHHYWGGLRATQRLADLARVFGLKIAMHSNSHLGISLAAMTHVAATIPNLDYACDTHYPWQEDEVIAEGRLAFAHGTLAPPPGPGLGVTLDRTALAALHQTYLTCGIRVRDDAKEMRKYDPSWSSARPRF